MLGVLFLAVAAAFGYGFCEVAFPGLKTVGKTTFDNKELRLNPYLIAVFAWMVAGLIPLTWATYLTAYVLKVVCGVNYPLGIANGISMSVFAVAAGLLIFYGYRRRQKEAGAVDMEEAAEAGTDADAKNAEEAAEAGTDADAKNAEEAAEAGTDADAKNAEEAAEAGYRKPEKARRVPPLTKGELVFLALVVVFVTRMMFLTFFVSQGQLYVGLSVFSDFAPHLGMIRSFSYGNNFPTAYSHFAGEDVRYHFLFQFLVGNLEYLGMRIDFAFNLPSIFGMVATCVLLYALAVRMSGKRMVGYLTTLFFLFRSSPSFFRYLAELPKGEVWNRMKEQLEFISFTQNEGWGFWNLNVYCNQRHLALALAVMLLALHYFMPYLYKMADKLVAVRERVGEEPFTGKALAYCRELFFSRGAFGVVHPFQALFFGLLLGGIAFFNGSVLIATCAMLFFMAAVSDGRMDYLITAVIALILSLFESKLFVTGSVVSPSYYFGFLADNKTFFGVVDYMVQLWGILLLFLLGYLLLGRGVKRYLVFVYSVPLFLAFTLSLTVDIGVNHKFIILAEMLLSFFPALVVAELLDKESGWLPDRVIAKRIVAAGLIVLLTITGVFEYRIVKRRNIKEYDLVFDRKDPVTMWLKENANSDDIILSSWYSLNRVVLGGGMLYYGWPYYAWSAGYDTGYREQMVARMYSARTPETLDAYVRRENIRFIIVDRDARENTSYYVREDVIAATYEAVYTEGEDDWKFTIYDTTRRRQNP